jgi:hypothetical protein
MDNKTPHDRRLSLYLNLTGMRTPLLLLLLLLELTTQSQQLRKDAATREHLHAAEARALPRLYEKKDFDSIGFYIQLRWREPVEPDLLCQAILLSIQRNIFSLTDFSDLDALTQPLINQLTAYANLLAACQDTKCNMPDADRKIVFTTSRWAYELLSTRPLDSVQNFLCRVYSGNIRYPDAYLSTHTVAPVAAGIFGPRTYRLHRLGAVMTIGTGVWLPNGHLSLLGAHPAVNFGFGVRNAHNEWDFDCSLRFANTPGPYTILRNDTLMSRTYYDGGNMSLTYTRYLIHRTRWEVGLSTGIGVDGFDVTSSSQTVDWSPTTINSFDLNMGLRYNFYFSKHGFLGLAARYHFVNYCNPGGSPLDGNAATIDIILGGAGEYKH